MTTAQQKLDEAEVLVEIKKLEGSIVTKFDEIEKAYEQADGEMKSLGKITEETAGAMDQLRKDYDAMYERVQELEQKGAEVEKSTIDDTIAKQFMDSDVYKSFQTGSTSRARVEVTDMKTAIINATGQNQPLVPSDRVPGIHITPNRNLRIRDILPSSPTNSNLVEFTREASFTNNAGPQIGGSPEAYENVTKPESAMTFSLQTAPVITLAHFIPASKQVLDDAASLESHINMRLMYGLKLKEETQLLSGTGANHQLNGLITQATSYAQSFSPNTTNKIDIVRDAIRQAHVGEYQPDFLVLNTVDWFEIETQKVNAGTDDRYIIGDPNSLRGPNIWGLPVVVTNSISSGTFLMGSSMAVEIKDRQQAAVEMSFEDSDNFQKNMVTIRAEERLTLVVYRTEALISGSI